MTKHPISSVTQNAATKPSRLLTPTELAEILGVPVATLYAWRYHGKGPVAVRIGRHLRYPADGLRQWLQECAKDDRRA